MSRPAKVAQDLHFDMAGAGDVLFHVNIAAAERGFGLGAAPLIGGFDLPLAEHRAGAAPAAVRARALSPNNSRGAGAGPTKIRPACAQRRAKSALSARNP